MIQNFPKTSPTRVPPVQDAALISQIKDRSKIALQNADVRKRKAALNTRILGLDNLIKKGKTTKAIITERRHNVRTARSASYTAQRLSRWIIRNGASVWTGLTRACACR